MRTFKRLMFVLLILGNIMFPTFASEDETTEFITRGEFTDWLALTDLPLSEVEDAVMSITENHSKFQTWYKELADPDGSDYTDEERTEFTMYKNAMENGTLGKIHDVCFVKTGGEFVEGYTAPMFFNEDTSVPLPTSTEVIRRGYIFEGWYDNINYSGNPFTVISGRNANAIFYAKWTKTDLYNINYFLDGGKIEGFEPILIGDNKYVTPLPSIEQVKKDGFAFMGFYDNKSFSGSSVTEIPIGVLGWYDVYAKWDANAYSIFYELNGGSWIDGFTPPMSRKYDAQITLPVAANMVLTGWSFKGWYEKEDLSGSPVTYVPKNTKEKKYYAKWGENTYTITYKLNNGSWNSFTPTTSRLYSVGVTLPVATNVKKAGATFLGWMEDSDCLGPAVTKIDVNTPANKTFYAKWQQDNYKIEYELNSGSWTGSAPQGTRTISDSVTLPTSVDIKRTGYIFGGWYENSDFSGSKVTKINSGVVSDKKFYAKWDPIEYNITYEVDKGSWTSGYTAPSKGKYNVSTTLPTSTNISRIGFKFEGWYTNSGHTGSAVTETGLNQTTDKKYYAKWTQIKYTITYERNSGSWSSFTPITERVYDQKVTLPGSSNITRTDYEFLGWYTSSTFSGSPITEIPATSTQNYTLYAKWNRIYYNITYQLNGGSCSSSLTKKVKINQTITLPDITKMSKSNANFRGWFMANNDSGTRYSTINQSVATDMTLYAVFKQNTNWDSVALTDWMAQIPDDMYLNEINIPGAHDAGCYDMMAETDAFDSFADKFSKTQNMHIDSQMNNGVRMFDVRLCGYGASNGGNLCHGSQEGIDVIVTNISLMCECRYGSGRLYMDRVLDWAKSFLKSHPKETIIFVVTRESGSDDSEQKICDNFWNTAQKYKTADGNYKGLWSGSTWPKLGDVRGKIVLVDDFSGYLLNKKWTCMKTSWLKGSQYDGVTCVYENEYDIKYDDKKSRLKNTIFPKCNDGSHKINTTKGVKSPTGGYIYTTTAPGVSFETTWKPPFFKLNVPEPSNLNGSIGDWKLTRGNLYGFVLFNFISSTETKKIIATNP